MEPTTIAAQLREIAVYFDLDGDRHRAIAYDKAARSIEAAKGLHRLLDEGRLEELPGIGPSIARAVGDLARRGSSTRAREAAREVAGRDRRARAAAVGRRAEGAQDPRGARARRSRRGRRRGTRRRAARRCPGFGKISEQKILKAIEERRTRGTREIHIDAEEHATSLAQLPARARRGDARRGRRPGAPVVRDRRPPRVRDRDRTTATRSSIGSRATASSRRSIARAEVVAARLADGMRCEIHLATRAHFGWALICATGSPEHVELLQRARRIARRRARPRSTAPDEADVYTRARPAVAAARSPRRHRRARGRRRRRRLHRSRHARRRDDRVPLPHDVQRRQGLDRGDGARRRRARHAGDHDHRSLGGGDATPAASTLAGLRAQHAEIAGAARPAGARARAAPRPTSSPTARSTCRPRSCPSSTS